MTGMTCDRHHHGRLMKPLRSDKGFTLIELMIVVAIVAILATIAYPSYREQIARSRRADAKAVLLESAQWIERQYTVSNSYILKGDGTTLNSAALPFQESPKDGGSKYYDIAFGTGGSASTTLTYVVRAVPKGAMTGDKCGTFTVTQTGLKGLTGNSGSGTVDDCWGR